ncbi:MAG TPA: hypothetical protein VGS11_08105 [Candidatus Bathyarchaeia archaeon]|nr:hypothetical protein [Candidatus Bathyarchaeia archaeon]
MGRFSLLLGRGLKVVGLLLVAPFVLLFFFIVPLGIGPSDLVLSILITVGLAAIGGALYVVGKIVAPNDSWLDSRLSPWGDDESFKPDEEAEGEDQLPRKQID